MTTRPPPPPTPSISRRSATEPFPGMKRIASLAAALAALLLAGCPARKTDTPAPRAAATDESTLAKVSKRDLEEAVEATGFVESVNAPFDVRAEISGRVLNLPVETGTPVKRGQKLLELDDTYLKADNDEALRNEQLARLAVDRAERDERRQADLFKEGFATEKARQDAKIDADFARVKLEAAKATVSKTRTNLAKAVIRAPFDGFVSDLGATADQVVSGNGTLLMRIYDFSQLRVVVKLNEFDAARVGIGRAASVTFDSLPGVVAPGKVGYISPFATSEQNLRVFTTKVDFSPKDAPVRPGVSATVRIVTRRAPEALCVPVSAVFIEGNARHVYVRDNNNAFSRREVNAGISDTGFVEIRAGLAEGDVVSLVRPAGVR